jgi:hypothetical protein
LWLENETQPSSLSFGKAAGTIAKLLLAKALSGSDHDAQLFFLQQAVELFDTYSAKISECDLKREQQYQTSESRANRMLLCQICQQPSPSRAQRMQAA